MAVGSWQLAVGSWQLAVGSWQLAVGSWQLAVGSWQLAVGSWQLAVGSWQLAVGSWQLAVGSWQKKAKDSGLVKIIYTFGDDLAYEKVIGQFHAISTEDLYKIQAICIYRQRQNQTIPDSRCFPYLHPIF